MTASGAPDLPGMWPDAGDDFLGRLLDWFSKGPDPAGRDELRARTTRMIRGLPSGTGPAGTRIGDGLILDLGPQMAAGIALRYAADAAAALRAGDPGKAADHLSAGYIAALTIGPLDSEDVREVAATLDRVAADWSRRR